MTDPTSPRADVRSKIVDVAARLLRDDGPAAVTTRRVAEEAGVQAPTIYRLFGDKEGLLEAVTEHVMAEWVRAKAETVSAASDAEVDAVEELRAGWAMQIDFGVANPALFRLMSDPNRVLSSPAARSGRQVLASRVHRVAAAGRLRISEQRAVELVQSAGIGTIHTLLSTPPEQRDTGLAAAMLDAVLAQILLDPPEPAENGWVATAVALRALAPRLDALSEAERQLLTQWLDRVVDTVELPRLPKLSRSASFPSSLR